MSRKYWLKILIPLLIPAVNVILLLIWAFGSGNDPIRKKFFTGLSDDYGGDTDSGASIVGDTEFDFDFDMVLLTVGWLNPHVPAADAPAIPQKSGGAFGIPELMPPVRRRTFKVTWRIL